MTRKTRFSWHPGLTKAILGAAVLAAGCTHITAGAPTSSPISASASHVAPNPSTSSTPTTDDSDDAQLRRVFTQFADTYNAQNWDVYVELMCAPMRAKFTGSVMDLLKKTRTQAGVTTISITSVVIDGDAATVHFDAHNEALGSKSVSLPAKREEDGWKVCQI